jgi:hypothetical protein
MAQLPECLADSKCIIHIDLGKSLENIRTLICSPTFFCGARLFL